MGDETEAKFRVPDFAAVRRALRKAGAGYLQTVIQTDRYFDTPDRSLLKSDRGIRIRAVRCLRSAGHRPDSRPQLTYKGPGRKGGAAKVRREIQAHVDSPEVVEKILETCGLEMALSVQKRRATYRLGRCTVELDELPLIGRFVEIEGPDEGAVLSAARRLGLTAEPIKDHYIDLLSRRCPRAGRACKRVHFDNCNAHCGSARASSVPAQRSAPDSSVGGW